jgi:hypothetical protein
MEPTVRAGEVMARENGFLKGFTKVLTQLHTCATVQTRSKTNNQRLLFVWARRAVIGIFSTKRRVNRD